MEALQGVTVISSAARQCTIQVFSLRQCTSVFHLWIQHTPPLALLVLEGKYARTALPKLTSEQATVFSVATGHFRAGPAIAALSVYVPI